MEVKPRMLGCVAAERTTERRVVVDLCAVRRPSVAVLRSASAAAVIIVDGADKSLGDDTSQSPAARPGRPARPRLAAGDNRSLPASLPHPRRTLSRSAAARY